MKKPWFATSTPCKNKKALILGSGIAGASLAYILANKGWEIDIIDKACDAGSGGSGNHCGAVTPLITLPDVALGRFYEKAFCDAVSFYKELGIGKFEGLKHYAYDKTYLKRWMAWKDKENRKDEKSEIFSLKEDGIGKYFDVEMGGYLQPFKVCKLLMSSHKNITFHPNNQVKSFEFKDGMYELKTDKKSFFAPALIIALGYESEQFLPKHSLSLQRIRGQVSLAKEVLKTKQPLCAKGYICPFVDGKQVIGATYIKDDECKEVRMQDHQENLENVKEFLGDLNLDVSSLEGRVSYRCSSSDRFPIIGALGDVEFYKNAYKALPWKKHKAQLFEQAKYLPNLFISTAHGSRGLVSAILGAKLIAKELEGKEPELSDELLVAIHPMRFIIRRLQKQEKW